MEFTCKVIWRISDNESFKDGKYSREHKWVFDGGVEVVASSSPHVVPIPFSTVEAVDPEEALVASVSSCHMLWFLSIAARQGYRVLSYTDDAVGFMGKNEKKKVLVTRIILRPQIVFSDDHIPSTEDLDHLHHLAHEECFIANSLLTQIDIEPRIM
jgi:organic hydroperoxide reductase OsmC/OhrA